MFAIIPDSGYEVDFVSVDGVNVGAVTTYTFTNVRADHTIIGIFKTITADPCAGVPAWDGSKWGSYRIGDFVVSSGMKYRCKAISWCQFDPAGPYGIYSWDFVGMCK